MPNPACCRPKLHRVRVACAHAVLDDRFMVDSGSLLAIPFAIFVVLVQELERWEKLNIKMSKTLAQLKMALVGTIAMSNELDQLGCIPSRAESPSCGCSCLGSRLQ